MSNTGTVIAAVLVGAALGYGASRIPTTTCSTDHYILIDPSAPSAALPTTCVSLSKAEQMVWQTRNQATIDDVKIPDWTGQPPGVNANPYPAQVRQGFIVLSGPMQTNGLRDGMDIRYSVKVGTGTFFGHIIIKK